MLEHLSKNNNLWVKVANNICNNTQTAKDLVQEMYLKCYDLRIPKEKLTKNYVIVILYNLFKDKCKKSSKTIQLPKDYNLRSNEIVTEIGDNELYILEKASKLTEEEKRMLKSNYNNSLTVIAEQEDTYRQDVFWKLRNARIKVLGHKYFKNKKTSPHGDGSRLKD